MCSLLWSIINVHAYTYSYMYLCTRAIHGLQGRSTCKLVCGRKLSDWKVDHLHMYIYDNAWDLSVLILLWILWEKIFLNAWFWRKKKNVIVCLIEEVKNWSLCQLKKALVSPCIYWNKDTSNQDFRMTNNVTCISWQLISHLIVPVWYEIIFLLK